MRLWVLLTRLWLLVIHSQHTVEEERVSKLVGDDPLVSAFLEHQ